MAAFRTGWPQGRPFSYAAGENVAECFMFGSKADTITDSRERKGVRTHEYSGVTGAPAASR